MNRVFPQLLRSLRVIRGCPYECVAVAAVKEIIGRPRSSGLAASDDVYVQANVAMTYQCATLLILRRDEAYNPNTSQARMPRDRSRSRSRSPDRDSKRRRRERSKDRHGHGSEEDRGQTIGSLAEVGQRELTVDDYL